MDRLTQMADGVTEVVVESLRERDLDVRGELRRVLVDNIAESLKCPTCNGTGAASYGSTGPDPEPPAACPECMGTGVHL